LIYICRRFSAAIVILVLAGCSGHTRWSVKAIKAGDSEFNSSRLVYRCPSKTEGIDLEFLKTKQSLNLYFVVHSHPVPGHEGNPHRAHAVLEADGSRVSFMAHRHLGGQRVLCPAEIQEKIIKYLFDAIPVTIHLGGYQATIEPARFTEHYNKMHYPPKF
jgi:hypothetical protein